MSLKAKFVVATAIAGSLAVAGGASALTPLSADARVAIDQEDAQASPYASAAPSAFEATPEQEQVFEPNPELNRSGPRLQCVPFAREASGVEIYGNANTWWQQAVGRFLRTHAPEMGAVMVMRGYQTTRRGHVAVVRQIISDRVVLVDHANWLNAGEITRAVPVRDVSERGDWSRVQVWHVPGQQWGARTYTVQGFILPEAVDGSSGRWAHTQDASAPAG